MSIGTKQLIIQVRLMTIHPPFFAIQALFSWHIKKNDTIYG